MYFKKNFNDGTVKYYEGGKEVRLKRDTGRIGHRLPDIARFFLSPAQSMEDSVKFGAFPDIFVGRSMKRGTNMMRSKVRQRKVV